MVNEEDYEFKELTDKEWLLLRPQNIIGSVQEIKQSGYNLKNNKFVYEDFYIVPGFLKIINEIIDNSVDVFIKSGGKFATKIDVTMTDITVKVKDNGSGIPVEKRGGKYVPYLAWGRPRAGTNFDDSKNVGSLGMNGIGSYATAVFSKEFVGTTCDGKKKLVVTFKNNIDEEKVSAPVVCKLRGTMVEFKPDLKRFGLTKITEIYKNAIKQRLFHIAYSYPGITFKFNNEVLKVDAKSYFAKFGDDVTLFQGKNYSVAFLPNESDDFRYFAYTNGLHNSKGGTQIDYFLDRTVNLVKDKIARKHKDIKTGDIKNKLQMIVILKDFKEAKFDSQSKEMFTSPASKITDHIGKLDFSKWGEALYKNKGIVQKAIEMYEIKEAYKDKVETKKLGKKKVKSEKYYPPTGRKKYLMVCEGACLDENTEVLTRDFSSKTLKDINVGEEVLNSDGTFQKIYSKRSSLKEGLMIKGSNGSEVVIGNEHRMWVYDTEMKEVTFSDGETIKNDTKRYKLIKSKMKESTKFLLITSIHADEDFNYLIKTDSSDIFGTKNDNFLVLSEGKIIKRHISKLEKCKDFIIFHEYDRR